MTVRKVSSWPTGSRPPRRAVPRAPTRPPRGRRAQAAQPPARDPKDRGRSPLQAFRDVNDRPPARRRAGARTRFEATRAPAASPAHRSASDDPASGAPRRWCFIGAARAVQRGPRRRPIARARSNAAIAMARSAACSRKGTAYAGSPAAFRWTAICSTGWARRPSAPPLLCGAAGRGARSKVGQDGLADECMRKLDADGHSAQEVGAGQLVSAASAWVSWTSVACRSRAGYARDDGRGLHDYWSARIASILPDQGSPESLMPRVRRAARRSPGGR